MMMNDFEQRIQKLDGKTALLQTWELFRLKDIYDADYVRELQQRVNQLRRRVGVLT